MGNKWNLKGDALWKQVIAFDNLWLAYRKTARGKRGLPAAASFELELEVNLIHLHQDLIQGAYQPGPYISFYIHDPKHRLISAARFRDRVVHHALCNILEPIFERKFIFDTYANRKGKGTHAALQRCTKYLRRYGYVMALDVRQFFPSIDHQILLAILGRAIADEKVLDLCQRIIASGQGVLKDEYDMVFFSGDDLQAVLRGRGLPIGNLTSQFWGNAYLNGLDHFIKRDLKCSAYIRYVDDMLLFSDDRQDLNAWCRNIISFLADLRLTLHENSAQSRPCWTGVPFLGFQMFPDHRRLKRRKVVHARKKLKSLLWAYHGGQISLPRLQAGIKGWINHARYGDTWGLRQDVLGDLII
jgi:RNA-directed DNA polymerase